MIRIQIQLEPATREALRRRAFDEGKSVAAVAREIIDAALRPPPPAARPEPVRSLFPYIGIVKNDPDPVAEHHDDYLYEEEEK